MVAKGARGVYTDLDYPVEDLTDEELWTLLGNPSEEQRQEMFREMAHGDPPAGEGEID
jgi:hypothetical protein